MLPSSSLAGKGGGVRVFRPAPIPVRAAARAAYRGRPCGQVNNTAQTHG